MDARALKAVCSSLLPGFRSLVFACRALNLLYPRLPNRLSNIVSDFPKNAISSFHGRSHPILLLGFPQ